MSNAASAIKRNAHLRTVVTVEENEREIILTGSVEKFYFKQLAQEIVKKHLNDKKLVNLIKVN